MKVVGSGAERKQLVPENLRVVCARCLLGSACLSVDASNLF
jgi:hypothetical protein